MIDGIPLMNAFIRAALKNFPHKKHILLGPLGAIASPPETPAEMQLPPPSLSSCIVTAITIVTLTPVVC